MIVALMMLDVELVIFTVPVMLYDPLNSITVKFKLREQGHKQRVPLHINPKLAPEGSQEETATAYRR